MVIAAKKMVGAASAVMWRLLTEPIDLGKMRDRSVNAFLLFFNLAFMFIISNTLLFFDCKKRSAEEEARFLPSGEKSSPSTASL